VSVSPAPSPAAVGAGGRAAVPVPRADGEVTTALAQLKSDLRALEQLVTYGRTESG
jgi:hypothetical protein